MKNKPLTKRPPTIKPAAARGNRGLRFAPVWVRQRPQDAQNRGWNGGQRATPQFLQHENHCKVTVAVLESVVL